MSFALCLVSFNFCDAINPQQLIHQNRKTVMKIYLKTFAQDKELDSAQTAQLMDIALMTPYIGGDAVYSARVMLGIDPDDYGVPYRLIETETQIEKKSIKVYPNPANDNVTVELMGYDNLQYAEIQIYGLVGNLIFNKKITENVSNVSVAELKSGLYFYNVIVNNNCIAKEKLIIVK